MIIVGDHLAESALTQSNNSNSDLFARSAFNRYYYAVYLTVKERISKINPVWGNIPHKSLPELLTGKVTKFIKNDIKKKIKQGVFSPYEGESLKQKVVHSANELSNLLFDANRIRVIADYEPDVKVILKGSTFILDGEKISEAKRWKNIAEIHTNSIMKAYRDVGII